MHFYVSLETYASAHTICEGPASSKVQAEKNGPFTTGKVHQKP